MTDININPATMAFGTPAITEANGEQMIVGEERQTGHDDTNGDHSGAILTTARAWPRRALTSVIRAELPTPHNGCRYVLLLNDTGYLYRDATICSDDFDAILNGTSDGEPYRLRNDM
jgi:hypothetical protein